MTQNQDSNLPNESSDTNPSESSDKPKIVFAPGCFDNFEGTQEELQELIAEIHRMFASGEVFANAQPLDEEEEERLLGVVTRGPLN